MSWFKVDSTFPHHPKVLSIPKAQRYQAVALWTLAGSWSAKFRTGGHVPAVVVTEDLMRDGGLETADVLVRATGVTGRGLWIPVADGWVFHDWEVYNPPAGHRNGGTGRPKVGARRAS